MFLFFISVYLVGVQITETFGIQYYKALAKEVTLIHLHDADDSNLTIATSRPIPASSEFDSELAGIGRDVAIALGR